MIDWLQATIDDRKALYRVLRRAMDHENFGWSEVFAQALGNGRMGGGYEDNFRAGRISRKKAGLIAGWLVVAYPAYADQLETALGLPVLADSKGGAWERLLAERGRYGDVSAMLLPKASLHIVSFAHAEPLARPVIPLGASFCFQIESAVEGKAIALQSLERRWFALPLRDDVLADDVLIGGQYLPRQSGTDQPYPLSDDEHDGRHGFAFVIGAADLIDGIAALIADQSVIAPATLNDIARRLLAHDQTWALLRINLLFVR